jgi:hypothetical protein
MPETRSKRRCAGSENGPSTSSSDPTPPKVSRSCPGAGSWSVPWHGLTVTDGSQRTSNRPSLPLPHGASLHPFNSSFAASQGVDAVPNIFESDSQRRRKLFICATEFPGPLKFAPILLETKIKRSPKVFHRVKLPSSSISSIKIP